MPILFRNAKPYICIFVGLIIGGGLGLLYLHSRSESASGDGARSVSEEFGGPSTRDHRSVRSDSENEELQESNSQSIAEEEGASDVADVTDNMESVIAMVTSDVISISFGEENAVTINDIFIEDYEVDRLIQLLHENKLQANMALHNADSAPQFSQLMQKLGSEGIKGFSLSCRFGTMRKDGVNYLTLGGSDGANYRIDPEWNCFDISKN